MGSYRDPHGRRRDLVALHGRIGSLLVVDRDAATLRDRFLLAHLAADEPTANAELVCRDYLARPDRRRCRRLRASDLLLAPAEEIGCPAEGRWETAAPIDAHGRIHRLRRVRRDGHRPELRWCRARSAREPLRWEAVSLRELVATLESYEPARTITAAAIAGGGDGDEGYGGEGCGGEDDGGEGCGGEDDGGEGCGHAVSVRHLQGEYSRLCTSPVVLNRALRETVVSATDSGHLTMSEIALRCGIVKLDRQGRRSGETSWLARRVGLMPEGGAERATPWIHSDVLALIAREGLRMSPREVEVP